MSSPIRRLQKRLAKRQGKPIEVKTQQYQVNEDGGYSVLHPTKGWRRVSPKRI